MRLTAVPGALALVMLVLMQTASAADRAITLPTKQFYVDPAYPDFPRPCTQINTGGQTP